MHARDLRASDREKWLRLWRQYNEFYETAVPVDITDYTWKRILDPNFPIIGRVMEIDGTIAGFSLSVLHEGTWVIDPVCYLEDLFVVIAHRGAGVGRALIEDLIALAKVRGWSRLYWHTKRDNLVARRLYDKLALADDFVRYRISLGANS